MPALASQAPACFTIIRLVESTETLPEAQLRDQRPASLSFGSWRALKLKKSKSEKERDAFTIIRLVESTETTRAGRRRRSRSTSLSFGSWRALKPAYPDSSVPTCVLHYHSARGEH